MPAGRGAPPPRVTLLDVAQRAGVSRTTASFVMTGRRDMRISADAEQRVLRAARELSYRPSLLARSLRTNLSQTIGLLSDVIAIDAFAGEMVRGTHVHGAAARPPDVHRARPRAIRSSRRTSSRTCSTAASAGSSTPRCTPAA